MFSVKLAMREMTKRSSKIQGDRAKDQGRGEQQEQKLQLAGASLLVNRAGQQDLNEQRRFSVNIVDASDTPPGSCRSATESKPGCPRRFPGWPFENPG